jgi:hypothetical protein
MRSPLPLAPRRKTPAEERDEAAIMAVALAQPHRRGSRDPALSEPLGAFCLRRWPPSPSDGPYSGNAGHRFDMFHAGRAYAEVVHHHRVLLGLGAGSVTTAEGLSCDRTEAQRSADLRLAQIERDLADCVLRGVHPRGVPATMRLCVDEIAHMPGDEDLIAACLFALAIHFEIQKPAFVADKPLAEIQKRA